MKKYFYAMILALVFIIASSVSLHAQTAPSGTPNSAANDYGDNNHTNYNYLGLLGLLGLYGLHKKRVKEGTVIDRKAM